MKAFFVPVCLFILFLSSGTGLMAQIVNIESQRIDSGELGWAGFIDLGFDFVKEERDIVSLRNTVHVQYTTGKNLYLLLNRFDLIKADRETLQNSLLQHLRFDRKISSLLQGEVFAQLQYNRVIRLKLRFLTGAGFRLLLIDKEPFKTNTGLLYMFEHEEIVDGDTGRFHRLSGYIAFTARLCENLNLGSTTYYQPRLDDFKDWRLSSESSLLFNISEKLSLNIQFNIMYDSRPPEGVVKTIYSLKNGLRFSF